MESDVNAVPQIRVLVVDDNEDIAEMLATILRQSGYEADAALSAIAAIEKCHAGEFEVIISDIGMPGMNGYELARHLRANGHETTVIIALTGFSIYGDRDRALEAGFDDLITKPVGPRSLLATVERLIKRRK
jgi:DNA-binding response OmpR family regulator